MKIEMKIKIVLTSVIVLLVFQSSCNLSNFLFGMMPSLKSQNEMSTEKALSKNDEKSDSSKTQQIAQMPSDKDKSVNVSISMDTYLAILNTIIKILTVFVAFLGLGFAVKYFGFSKEIKDWKQVKNETLIDMGKAKRLSERRLRQINIIKNDLETSRDKIQSQDDRIKPLEKILQPGKQFDFLIRGNDALKNQNYLIAEFLFRQSLLLEGESIGAWVGLAQALRGLEKFEDSLTAIDIALDLDKRDQRFDKKGDISYLKMEILDQMGRKAEAVKVAAEVMKKNPYSKRAKELIDSTKKPKKKK